MKQIEINGKKYDLHFGIDFIREMDKRYEIKGNGVSFGMGLQSAVVYLKDFNPVVIADIIQKLRLQQSALCLKVQILKRGLKLKAKTSRKCLMIF
ncbi:tail assembly chaperone [Streptococcus sanguinis]